MALYTIGDLHLSLGSDKPMDVFPGWEGYLPRLEASWRKLIGPDDTVVLAGDTSWAMNLNDTKADFAFIQNLPGQKWLLKGNHDYWWTTVAKMERFFDAHGLHSMQILHNNCLTYGDYALCGTRGWFYELDHHGTPNETVLLREIGRLEMSLRQAGDREILCFLHYPPLYQGYYCPEILRLLREYKVKQCYYGHLHGQSHRRAIEGPWNGTDFSLVSADYLQFVPKKIDLDTKKCGN